MIRYSDDLKHAYYNSLMFTRDGKTGYYLNSNLRLRLHRCVWQTKKGEIPKGYHIHHIDKDKGNNDIGNLQLLAGVQHARQHGIELTDEQRQSLRDNLTNTARPKASEWHGGKDGKAWHRKHYQDFKELLHMKEPRVCLQCSETYQSLVRKTDKFCSNKCKSAWRRKEGLDNETRVCGYCGKEFIENKYRKTTVCSKTCSMRLYPRNHGLNKNKED